MSDDKISEWDDLNAGLEILRLKISELEKENNMRSEETSQLILKYGEVLKEIAELRDVTTNTFIKEKAEILERLQKYSI